MDNQAPFGKYRSWNSKKMSEQTSVPRCEDMKGNTII